MVGRIQKEKALIETLIFFLKLNLLLLPFYAIIYFDLSYVPLQIGFAAVVNFIIKLFGLQIERMDYFLFLGEKKFPIDISFDCIGWKSCYSLLALVIASPGKSKNKINFLLKWIPILFVINLMRIIIVILFGFAFSFSFMEMIHTYVFQPLMIFIIIFVWTIFLKSYKTKFKLLG